jgi:hypothetical protein
MLGAALGCVAGVRAGTIVVGPADGSCPDAIFSRVQSALDAAVPGATIFLCAGTYSEQLVVTKGLHLVAAPGARLVPPALAVTTTSPDSRRPVAAAVTLRAPAVVDGLAIDLTAHGITTCDDATPLLAGIYVGGVSASIVGTSVVGARIPDAPAGCTNGVAILVEGGGRRARVRVEGNGVAAYQGAGIVVQDAGARASVRENLVVGDGDTPTHAQAGIAILNGAAARIADNVVRAHAGASGATCDLDAGIVLGAPRLRVTGNQLEANAVGIRAASRGHMLRGNAIDGGGVGLVGLDLDADESRVGANTVTNEAVAAVRIRGNRNVLRGNVLMGVHQSPTCDVVRDAPGCAPSLARCGAGLWLLGSANAVTATTIADADAAVVDDGRANVVR